MPKDDGWIRTRAGWRFRRLEDGTVRIEVDLRGPGGHTERTIEAELPAQEWVQVVALLSGQPGRVTVKAVKSLHAAG